MTAPFPSREALQAQGLRSDAIAEYYDIWRHAHAEGVELAAELPAVFGNPPRPRVTLHVARGYDDEWVLTEERVAELAALDPEQHWTDVTHEATKQFQEYFCFTDAEGLRFYLPAFLRHYLADFPISGWEAVYHACVRRSYFELLTPEQNDFVTRFLALCHAWEDH